ncbi:MAG TPA: molybdopterin dinucleotide binding domain-containing protein, partial [Acidimicrobiales bacterium]|nr:molybdopterin dinucleotide binding domain-containing protein [Acidimicrobiales bacterium]
DGQLVGADAPEARRALDPMAFPGISSVESVGLGDHAGDTVRAPVSRRGISSVVTLDEVMAGRVLDVPRHDSYAFGLIVARQLYDRGIAMQGSPALEKLVAATSLALAAKDMDRLGVAEGELVNVVGARGAMVLRVTAANAARGTVRVTFGARSDDDATQSWHALVDPNALVSEVRVETR